MKNFVEKNQIIFIILCIIPGALIADIIGHILGIPNVIIVSIQLPLLIIQLTSFILLIKYDLP